MLSTEKTLSEVIEILWQRGYTEDFNLLEENISYKKGGEKVDLNDIVIDKIYRFTGQNDLDDETILYAMRNRKDGAKGVFVNGYGTYTDSGANAVISKINVEENDNDDWTVEKWFLLNLHREIFIFHISHLRFVADSSPKLSGGQMFSGANDWTIPRQPRW